MAAIGSAKFGSGLLSVTFCRPSMYEIGVRVIIGRCDHRMFNAYYDTALTETDMTLTKDTNVNVRVECADLGYDSGTLGVDGDLLASYHDIPDLNNDPVVYDDVLDLSTIKGDSVRYFVIRGAKPDTSYSIDISTDAVSGSTGGRLNTMTLTGRTLPRGALRGGALSCQKHSYFDSGESFTLAIFGSALWGWDQDTGEAKHTYGTPTTWTVVSADAAGLVTYTGTGDPSNGDMVALYNSTTAQTWCYVTAINTGAGTFTAEDSRGNTIDFVAGGWDDADTMLTVGDEPPTGLSGLYMERILDNDPHFYASLDDTVYVSRQQANNYLPLHNTADTRGDYVERIQGNTTAQEGMSLNRDTATRDELAFAQLARFYFLQPYNLEGLQTAAGVFIRGDWDLTTGNDFDHSPRSSAISTAWNDTNNIDPAQNLNPMLDANFAARMTNMVTIFANGTDVWNTYFAGGNPHSFLSDKGNIEYPPLLTMDSSGSPTVDPVATYGVDPKHYYNRGFVIENERHCILCADSMSHRDGAFHTSWDAHPYWSNETDGVNHIFGGRFVWGAYQEAEVQKKLSSVAGRKAIGVLNKGMVLLGTYDLSEINTDSAAFSAVAESARISTYMQSIGGALMMVGDRHVEPSERAAGKGRAEESGFVQQIISGAHQSAYGTPTSNDLTFGLITATADQLRFQTKLVVNTILHDDNLRANTMARRTIKATPTFGESGPNNPQLGFGQNDYSAISAAHAVSGFPLILDQSSDGAGLILIEGIGEKGGTTNTSRYLWIDTGASSEILYDGTVEDPLPIGTVLTFTSPIDGYTFSIGADMGNYTKSLTGQASQFGAKYTSTTETDYALHWLANIRANGKASSNTATTLVDNSKMIAFDAASLDIEVGDRVLKQLTSNSLADAEEYEITEITDADTLTHVSGTNPAAGAYWVFKKNYCFTATGGGVDDQVDCSSGTDFTDAAFQTALQTNDLVIVNLVTGTVININGNGAATSTATKLKFGSDTAAISIQNGGRRAGLHDANFNAGDVCVILPAVTVSASYTDATESGGGNTTVERTIERTIERT